MIRLDAPAAFGALLLAAALPAAFGQGPPRLERATFELSSPAPAEPGATARLSGRVTIESGWHTNSNRPSYDYLIPTAVTVAAPAGWPEARVTYPEGAVKKFGFAEEPLSVYDGTVEIPIALEVPANAPPGRVPITASLRYQACDDRTCLAPVTTSASVELVVGEAGAATAPPAPSPTAAPDTAGGTAPDAGGAAPRRGLGWMLLLGFLGGIILNAMPCVLPVLSLKIFGLVRAAGEGQGRASRGALAAAAGIVVSFLALAAAAVAARSAGAAVGWGVQFQEPRFVAFLAVVVVLFCLNLWGLFEVPLPRRLAAWADAGGQGESTAGHFASGLFATLMATPCSAPFLGTAVGFALSQPTATVFAIFTAVGVGMALPYLLFAAAPGAARLFPKPGPWMETLKVAMGFLLAGAAVWLFYVLAGQVPPARLALVQLGLLALALFAFLRHQRILRGRRPLLSGVGMLAAAVFCVVAVRGDGSALAPRRAAGAGQLVDWVEWNRAEAESLAAAGRIVFVDVTADWCFTCKVNERLILETPEVAGAFERHRVVAMRADWTNRSDEIARFLAEHGRAGIPFYMLYRPGREPKIFAELLTKDGLLADLDAAGLAAATLAR